MRTIKGKLWHRQELPDQDFDTDIVFYEDTGIRYVGYYDPNVGFIDYCSGDVFDQSEVVKWAYVDDIIAVANCPQLYKGATNE